jgi:hypothetical protein
LFSAAFSTGAGENSPVREQCKLGVRVLKVKKSSTCPMGADAVIRLEAEFLSETQALKHNALIGTLVGIAFTPFAAAMALKSAGRGDLYWAGVFYPTLTMLMVGGAGTVVVPLALLQYPFFGWYTGRCIARENYIRLAVLLLVIQVIPMLVAILN